MNEAIWGYVFFFMLGFMVSQTACSVMGLLHKRYLKKWRAGHHITMDDDGFLGFRSPERIDFSSGAGQSNPLSGSLNKATGYE